MERVMVVGTSCSGKTTLARSLARAMGVPHVELDVLHWLPGWSERPLDEFRAAVGECVEDERWVVDGNYSKVRDLVLSRATDAVWLNYSFPVMFGRSLARTARRVASREELFGGNRETFRSAFLSRDSIPWWVLRTYRRRRVEYRQLFRTEAASHIRVLEIRNPREADALVAKVRESAGVGEAAPGRPGA